MKKSIKKIKKAIKVNQLLLKTLSNKRLRHQIEYLIVELTTELEVLEVKLFNQEVQKAVINELNDAFQKSLYSFQE